MTKWVRYFGATGPGFWAAIPAEGKSSPRHSPKNRTELKRSDFTVNPPGTERITRFAGMALACWRRFTRFAVSIVSRHAIVNSKYRLSGFGIDPWRVGIGGAFVAN